ncbi:MAG: MBL fold metallo-hydrolase RNA specificity domain-containing protein, partial [Candidatus Micrarchaeota archaeon]
YAYGYEGPTYCTPATRDLTVLLLQDCINVMNSEGKGAPYGEKDVKKMLNHTITREYGEVTDVTPEVRFTFYNAGHILGSSQVHLHVGEGMHNLVFTGDLKYGRTKLLDAADTRFPRIETLIMESTYGGSHDLQPPIEEGAAKIARIVRQTMERRGKTLIPVFSVGRAQEIMLILEEQFREEDGIKVYIDGMCKEANAIHTVYPEYLRHNIRRRILQNDSPFDKPLFSHVVPKNRKDIAESEDPSVIIAPSGMLTGGTSVEFLKMLAHDERNSLIFVGYQGASSLGRKIQMGSKEVPLLNDKNKLDSLKINFQVESADAFSGHSDRLQLISYVRALRPKPLRILTVHGEESKCDDLSRSLSRIIHVESRAPMDLDTTRLK